MGNQGKDIAKLLVGRVVLWTGGPGGAGLPLLVFSSGNESMVSGLCFGKSGVARFRAGVRPVAEAKGHPHSNAEGYYAIHSLDEMLVRLLGDPSVADALALGGN